MKEYRIVVKDPSLASEINRLTAEYSDRIIELLQRAKATEKPDDFYELRLGIGHVLATLGETILFPIYLEHPGLTPPLLKDIVERKLRNRARQHGESEGPTSKPTVP